MILYISQRIRSLTRRERIRIAAAACAFLLLITQTGPVFADQSRIKLLLAQQCMKQKKSGKELDPKCRTVGVYPDKIEGEPHDKDEKPPVEVVNEPHPCVCLGGSRRQCTFSFCGFKEGWYSQPGLGDVADRIGREVKLWQGQKLTSLRFEGRADTTPWIRGESPKPLPVSEPMRRCVVETVGAVRWSAVADESDSLKDRLVAALRGCALRAEVALRHAFSFDIATEPVNTEDEAAARCAAFSFTVIAPCEEVQSD